MPLTSTSHISRRESEVSSHCRGVGVVALLRSGSPQGESGMQGGSAPEGAPPPSVGRGSVGVQVATAEAEGAIGAGAGAGAGAATNGWAAARSRVATLLRIVAISARER